MPDGAGWHHSTELHIPDNHTLLPLPPYSPELNPAEMLWREMRQRYLSNRVYPDREALDSAVAAAWLSLSGDTKRVQHLTNFDRIPQLLPRPWTLRKPLEVRIRQSHLLPQVQLHTLRQLSEQRYI